MGKVSLLLQVHDELVFEMPADLVEVIAPKIKEIMENVVDLEKTKGVVCKVEYKAGDNEEDKAAEYRKGSKYRKS